MKPTYTRHRSHLFVIVRPDGVTEQYTGFVRDLFFHLRRNHTRYYSAMDYKVFVVGEYTRLKDISGLFWAGVRMAEQAQKCEHADGTENGHCIDCGEFVERYVNDGIER